jgi:hypothetical protein
LFYAGNNSEMGKFTGDEDTEYIAEGFDWGSPAGKEVW